MTTHADVTHVVQAWRVCPGGRSASIHASLNRSAHCCAGMLCIGVHTTMDKQSVEGCQPDLVRPSITRVSLPDIVGLAKPEADSGAEQACEPVRAAGCLLHIVQVCPDLACTAEAVPRRQLQTESLQHCACTVLYTNIAAIASPRSLGRAQQIRAWQWLMRATMLLV